MKELKPEELYTESPRELLDFETTDELEAIEKMIGQDRAVSAIHFGIEMPRDGYNIYALGPDEADKRSWIEEFLKKHAEENAVPNDICYVNNFKEHYKPGVLSIPAGKGVELRDRMDSFIDEVQIALTTAFESEEYQNRSQSLEEEFKEEQGEGFNELSQKAQEQGLALLRTPAGFTFAPIKDGDIMSSEEIQKVEEEEKKALQDKIEKLQAELQKILRQMPGRQRKLREKKKELDHEFAEYSVKDLLDEIRQQFNDIDFVQKFLDDVKKDIIEHVQEIISQQQPQQGLLGMLQGQGDQNQPVKPSDDPVLRSYRINLLVDNSKQKGAPIIYEDNPNYTNLIGRVEYQAKFGALTTDFMLIKTGALHKANGGFLILDARKVLMQPYVWEALKRVLKSHKLRIESPGEYYGMISTVSLEPEPIDLDVKVILVGQRWLYYLLSAKDPDFSELFKVMADFNDQMDRNEKNQTLYARMIGSLVRNNELKPVHRDAVARLIEESARYVSDSEKLSARYSQILDLLRESDYWAGQNNHSKIERDDVQKAIDQKKWRSARVREQLQENILRKTIYIDTDGVKVGQINGLSVLTIGDTMFGTPTRITARIELGKGEVINIEREVQLSGPIHSKGVLILKGFIGERYAVNRPLSLSASLVFEQSYGGVDGDSASSTELYVLLSAIADIPIKQSLAVTGSINQHGQIQPIGGVNEKIEGFFEICQSRGLTGDQGVLIPRSNVKNLMLNNEVVRAARENKFHIYPVDHVDRGLELLTGMPIGKRDKKGMFPSNTINYKVEQRLVSMAKTRMQYTGLITADRKTDGYNE
ncbi:MAG TPA: ATP-binding protein [Balneolales bacterium]|nr:ATP-binding protein [Balneolales bacterium]